MAKKKIAKTLVGVGAVAVAGKLAYNKYKKVKEEFAREEDESVSAEVKKYNAIFDRKIVEVEDEEFCGCEVKAIAAKTVIDLGLASFEKDVYINFSSTASNVTIILPEAVNAACDIEKTVSGVRNLIENVDAEGVHTVYIIGKAVLSNVEIIPVNFYVDDDDFDDVLTEGDEEAAQETEKDVKPEEEVKPQPEVKLEDKVKPAADEESEELDIKEVAEDEA